MAALGKRAEVRSFQKSGRSPRARRLMTAKTKCSRKYVSSYRSASSIRKSSRWSCHRSTSSRSNNGSMKAPLGFTKICCMNHQADGAHQQHLMEEEAVSAVTVRDYRNAVVGGFATPRFHQLQPHCSDRRIEFWSNAPITLFSDATAVGLLSKATGMAVTQMA